MLILNASDVRKALPMKATVEAMKQAYLALSTGQAAVPLRAHLEIPDRQAINLFMPAHVAGDPSDSLACKIVTIFPNNVPAGLPLIHAAILALDADTGQVRALLEGATLTAIRTGAGAGAATDVLARPDCRQAAILGSGVQARTQLEAICAVRDFESIWVYSPNASHVRTFIAEMQPHVHPRLMAAGSAQQAVQQADVVCAATSARQPVFSASDLQAGAHVNGVGSFTPEMIEVPPELASRALVVVDSRQACQAEAGELIEAVANGLASWEEFPELGELLAGNHPGRTSADQITFFKSVGVAVQDALAAQLAVQNAARLGLGTEVDW